MKHKRRPRTGRIAQGLLYNRRLPLRISTGATANQICVGVPTNPDNAITTLAKRQPHWQATPVDGLYDAELFRP